MNSCEPEKERLLVVKVHWDGDVSSGGKELVEDIDLSAKLAMRRIPVKEAYVRFRGIVEGKEVLEGKVATFDEGKVDS